ncbi:LacI family DNA-binding transcriptional regulator [Streptomyces sp. NPDC004752]
MSTRKQRPSQRDIARVAGVSQTAVSMVLNGKADQYNLAQATQDRVLAAIAELNYVPDVAGRSLRGGRNNLIGVHTYESVFPVALDDYYHEFLIGIEQAAAKACQDLILFASTERPDGSRRIYGPGGNRLRLADGAVILGHEQNNAELKALAEEQYPFVYVGRREVPGAMFPYVTAEYGAGTRAAMGVLAGAGHEGFAYLGAVNRFSPLTERHEAFRWFLQDMQSVKVIEEFLEPTEVKAELITRLVDAGITAVVCETPPLAQALSEAAAQSRIEVPGDLSVIVLDHAAGPISTWSHLDAPRREMGVRAVEILLGLLEGEVAPDYREALACGPVARTTVAPPRTAAPGGSAAGLPDA